MEYLTLNRYTSPSTLLNYKLLHLCVSRLVLHPSPHPPQRSPRHHTCSPLDHFPNPRLGTRAATASQRKPLRISVCLRSPEIKSTLVFVLCAELYKRTTITSKKFDSIHIHQFLLTHISVQKDEPPKLQEQQSCPCAILVNVIMKYYLKFLMKQIFSYFECLKPLTG